MKRRISKFSTLLGAQQHLPEIPDSRSWSVIEKITSYLELMDFTNHRAKRYHEIIQAKHRKYGPVYRDRIGFSSTAVFVNSANAIQQIFMREGKYPMNFVPPCWSLYNDMRKRKRGLLFMWGCTNNFLSLYLSYSFFSLILSFDCNLLENLLDTLCFFKR